MADFEDGNGTFISKSVAEVQTTEAINDILFMVCSLTAGQDQATIQAGCNALGQMIRVEQKAVTD